MNAIPQNLSGRRILLIISGGISAYKSLDLIRRLKERGADVRCILTAGGAEFITPLAVSALSENKVYCDLFSLTDEQEMGHIRLARDCDLVLVAPASANLLARVAGGDASDLAATVLLATDNPVMLAPAMNPVMWQNAATQDNVTTLKKRGFEILSPASGDMACGEHGEGRLPEVVDIVRHVSAFFAIPGPLSGKTAIVTSGPTHEPLDPVRFLGNKSSGKQGHAIAAALALAGADVTLVSGPVAIDAPKNLHTVRVTTAAEMLDACLAALPADIAVCAAAVADYRPATTATEKIKKDGDSGMTLQLVQNPDILATLSAHAARPQLVIGFAAETDAAPDKAMQKMARKGCDWLFLNDVADGKIFGADDNTVTWLRTGQAPELWDNMTKDDVARDIVRRIAAHFSGK
jgi:phosphopantothenoylcysteine decarboxylase/phosphopantothenate--cysteine ligase